MKTDVRRRWSAPLRSRNYRAAWSTLLTSRTPADSLRRYVTGSGDYPWRVGLRTPTGPVELLVPHPHDVRTVNEIFHRHDYGHGTPEVVVDVGGNIGVSAAWFLSRSPHTRVHVWEPVPHNLDSLRVNVAPFGDRCVVHEAALAPTAGAATFLIDPVGRYSGLAEYQPGSDGKVAVEVVCEGVAEAQREVQGPQAPIDLLKVDHEGVSYAIVAAIPDDVRARIGEVVYEYPGGVRRLRQ